MKTIIKIEKEDIVTNRFGMNVEVQISSDTSLVFTTEALDELVKDYSVIKDEIQSTNTKIIESIRTAKDLNQLELNFDENKPNE